MSEAGFNIGTGGGDIYKTEGDRETSLRTYDLHGVTEFKPSKSHKCSWGLIIEGKKII